MAAIHPTPERRSNADAGTSLQRHQSTRTLARQRSQEWQKLLLRPDIAGCITLSKLRCVVTLVSLVLLVTDIPRTGLGVRNLHEYYPVPLMPSTAVRFGPFNYPVAHIWRTGNSSAGGAEFAGLEGTQPINAARVWYYQYDTLSVGLRGAVELLNVTDFPAFLLYKDDPKYPSKNADSVIDLGTAFRMLDAFISTAQAELRSAGDTGATPCRTLRYATKHNWVDRIHHYVVSFISKRPAWRLHSLHASRASRTSPSLSICSTGANGRRSPPRPRFCNHPGIWKCTNPFNSSLPAVRLWDHMDLRLQLLQQRYPDLDIEVALISTQRLSLTSGAMRSTFYNYEALEIVVLTRGRRCSTPDTCTTIFVDDYRYERDIVQTNLVDWYGIVATLRGGAQAYVWVRLVLLGYGAYAATAGSVAGKTPHWLLAVLIIIKIPFQVVVYSSLLPVAAYTVALLLDSNFMDIFLDSYWASVGGSVNFRPVAFLQSTAVQMRSVWLLALLAGLVVFVIRKTREGGDDGVPGIRGLLISFTATLTVSGPYKSTFFRDTNISLNFRLAHEGAILENVVHSNPGGYFNTSSYIFDDSATMLLFCVGLVVGSAFVIKVLGYLAPQSDFLDYPQHGVIISSTPIVPCGARALWPASLLSIHFFSVARSPPSRNDPHLSNVRGLSPSVNLIPIGKPFPTVSKLPPPHTSPSSPSKISPHATTHTSGKSRSGLVARLHSRTAEYCSIVQLMNVAMMTDPWNLIWLRVIGIPLFLYKIQRNQSVHTAIRDANHRSYALILPCPEHEMEERVGLSRGEYQLLDSVSSRDIPMTVLLQSG